MNTIWRKTTEANTLEHVMEELSGVSIGELLAPPHEHPQKIENLVASKTLISRAIEEGRHIAIIGDYDADGVTSVAILFLLLQSIGADVSVRIPKRLSEGYGLAQSIVEEVTDNHPGCLILTVDNGITANKAVSLAKERGSSVIILDHHLPSEELPQADCIVDPHVFGDGFRDYCGAGLSYALATLFLEKENPDLLKELLPIAAVGTVADVVPLIGENRVIVRDGLAALNDGAGTEGLLQLIRSKGISNITSETIAYQIAPALNAPGRLLDDGAKLSSGVLASRAHLKENIVSSIWSYNEQRKEIVSKALLSLENSSLTKKNPILLFDDTFPEGVCGIIAGNLAERYRKPAFVLSKSEDGNWKGSGRAPAGIHLKNYMDLVARQSDAILSYGGHEGAVGLKIATGREGDVRRIMEDVFPEKGAEEIIEYHLELPPTEIDTIQGELEKFEPFGAGCPRPKILWKGCKANEQDSYRFMGNTNQHVKVHCNGYDLVLFNKAKEFSDMGCPTTLDVIGDVSVNSYNDSLQIVVNRFRPSKQGE